MDSFKDFFDSATSLLDAATGLLDKARAAGLIVEGLDVPTVTRAFVVTLAVLSVVALAVLAVGLAIRQVLDWRRKIAWHARPWLVVVTGGCQGVGECLVNQLLHLSPTIRVAVIDRNPVPPASWAAHLGGRVHLYELDLACHDHIATTLDAIVRDAGRVPDFVVNNAGMVQGKYLTDLTTADVKRTLDVNLVAPMTMTRAVLTKYWLDRNEGHIVHVGSAAGLTGLAWLTDYCASKWGLYGFHESLRQELQYTNIKTSIICPTHINTTLFASVKPAFPFILSSLEPDYVASAIVDVLTKNRAQDVWLPAFVWTSLIARAVPLWLNDFGHWVMDANGFLPEAKAPLYGQAAYRQGKAKQS
ncbi:hypothetical protein GGF31_000878 [Allomyces arbusculus]|nr:hypothetical protein GGF31_000878 [Allomyces arbusculus]